MYHSIKVDSVPNPVFVLWFCIGFFCIGFCGMALGEVNFEFGRRYCSVSLLMCLIGCGHTQNGKAVDECDAMQ